MKPAARFDVLARPYQALERLAFGASLEAARFRFLDRLEGCDRVLILGEGDGRFLARLLRRFPEMRVECVEASGAMVARAQERLTPEQLARVNFTQADARTLHWQRGSFGAAVTLFFLDCFEEADATALIGRVAEALKPDALWLWADFAMPERGWRRARARLWLALLYAVFDRSTGQATGRLPEVAGPLRAAGFVPAAEEEFQAGLVKTVLWRRGAGPGGAAN